MASHEVEAYLLITAEEVGSALLCNPLASFSEEIFSGLFPYKVGDFVGENGYSSAPKDTPKR